MKKPKPPSTTTKKIEVVQGIKYIVQESHTGANAATQTIRLNLSSLDTYLPSIGNDIKKFNQYVKKHQQQLKACRENYI